MNTTRPTNLNLGDLRILKFPITAISSILHRVTGVILFVAIPIVLWLVAKTLSAETDYNAFLLHLNLPLARLIAWGILSSLSFHIVAGIRHLLMDLGFGETMEVAKLTSMLTIVVAVIAAASWGVWLW